MRQHIQQAVDAWTEYLEAKPWTMFATFTTAKPISLGSARRLMQKVGAKVLREGECMFWAAERFELGREGYHCHALINTRYSANQIEKWYSAHYGRAEVQRYNPLKGAAGYCAKYMTKRTFDYDMLLGGGALELFGIGGTQKKRTRRSHPVLLSKVGPPDSLELSGGLALNHLKGEQ